MLVYIDYKYSYSLPDVMLSLSTFFIIVYICILLEAKAEILIRSLVDIGSNSDLSVMS